MEPERLTTNVQSCEHIPPKNKRRSTSYDDSKSPHKIGRQSDQQTPADPSNDKQQRNPLPSPPPTKTFRDRTGSSHNDSSPQKRKARSLDYIPSNSHPIKRPREQATPVEPSPFIEEWLSHLPEGEKFAHAGENPSDMGLLPPKRSRSSDSPSRMLSQSNEVTESPVSREKKYAAYRDDNYSVVLEMKGSFMRPSDAGLVDEDKALCEDLLHISQPSLSIHYLMKNSIDFRPFSAADLKPESTSIYTPGCHSVLWTTAATGSHLGFKWSNFTETQRKKLSIDPSEKSYYTAREDIYFPFMTSEVQCGGCLYLADLPNTHSMTIALRGIVDLYRKANCASDVHRRALGFSISHDEYCIRIYVQYPEIDGEKTTFWRETIQQHPLNYGKGQANWTCGQFTLNVCQIFAPALLARLKGVIDRMADPIHSALELADLDDLSVQSSQNDSSAAESQASGLLAELRTMVHNLQQQLERERQESEQERKELMKRMEQEGKVRKELTNQMEQQQKGSEQQQRGLLDLLKQQSQQIREFSQKR
ncbi:hypothetical protein A1O3_06105 [Capronia epimyces CBS 606.96]|uniref:DUF7924 domain-containing protein n=1 Tax=Capronia epimyces CBS 606.96 TaxID=1182542 RepID=W9XP20_9EURO|nr:uncharacterized protein A1O3_06105 [Capronia epimyces CBS 606.96]EXJ82292.1 hypothetical protein A1O3_06105 [Capronia epimyces CBS 606.96]